MSTRTPFTQEVRSAFVNYHLGDKEEIAQAFDRWLAKHDASVLSGAAAALERVRVHNPGIDAAAWLSRRAQHVREGDFDATLEGPLSADVHPEEEASDE